MKWLTLILIFFIAGCSHLNVQKNCVSVEDGSGRFICNKLGLFE